jgi:hypothetical protein
VQLVNITGRAPAGPQGPWQQYITASVKGLIAAHGELDGVFYDNFWRSISWEQGTTIQVDSDCSPRRNPAGCDGIMDPPAVLDTLWNQALRNVARDTRARFDQLQDQRGGYRPLAILSNGAADYFTWVNGTMYEHYPNGKGAPEPGNPHGYAWRRTTLDYPSGYLAAPFSRAPYRAQIINAAWEGTWDAPQRSAEFERHKRFTLVSALLGDGYYSLGAAQGHGSTWWEPEFDGGGLGKGYLGYPREPVERIGVPTGGEQIVNGSFSTSTLPWSMQADRAAGSLRLDLSNHPGGPCAARLEVTSVAPGGAVKLYQSVPVFGGTTYTLSFWARASTPQEILLHLYGPTCKSERCLADQRFWLDSTWRRHEVSFISTGHAVAGLNLFVSNPGTVWIDEVSLRAGDTALFRRDFDRGIVLLNATARTEKVQLGGTFFRLRVPGSPLEDGSALTVDELPPFAGHILLRNPRPTDTPAPGPGPGSPLESAPNPFQPFTEIRFALPRDEHVRLDVYDVAGRRVRTLVDATLGAGVEHRIRWDGTGERGERMAPGVYFYRLETPTGTRTGKVTLAS